MASVAPEVVVEGTVAAPVGEAVVAGTVVAAPPGGVVVGTVVGATGHPIATAANASLSLTRLPTS